LGDAQMQKVEFHCRVCVGRDDEGNGVPVLFDRRPIEIQPLGLGVDLDRGAGVSGSTDDRPNVEV
jgi:hypothetical protein